MREIPSSPDLRYAVAACQTDFPCPRDRSEIGSRVDRMLEMVDAAVAGYRPFFPVRLLVFPEFAHAAPVYLTARELREKLAVPIPNEHTDRRGPGPTTSTSRPAPSWRPIPAGRGWSSTPPASSARKAS